MKQFRKSDRVRVLILSIVAHSIRAGFRAVPPGSTVIAGDVAIIQPYAGGNPSGHRTMYDGTTWYSDFRQNSMYPGGGYRAVQPAYKSLGRTDARVHSARHVFCHRV